MKTSTNITYRCYPGEEEGGQERILTIFFKVHSTAGTCFVKTAICLLYFTFKAAILYQKPLSREVRSNQNPHPCTLIGALPSVMQHEFLGPVFHFISSSSSFSRMACASALHGGSLDCGVEVWAVRNVKDGTSRSLAMADGFAGYMPAS